MAKEAVCIETPTLFSRYTCADGTGIAKGSVLQLTTPNTASQSDSDNDVMAGVAWMEKVASDGSTQITAARDGTWMFEAGTAAAITVGNDVVVNGIANNEVKAYTTLDDEKGYVLGKALETIGTAGVQIMVRLDI